MSVFDWMASEYDTPERREGAGIIADELRRHLGDAKDKTGLDYGCGTGLVGLPLAGLFRSLLMVDASPRMVEQVQRKIDGVGMENVKALCADFSREAPQDLSVDIVFTAQVLLHIPDTEGILRRLCTVLNPGGRLLVVDFDKNPNVPSDRVHNGFDQGQLAALAQKAGFTRAASHTFYHGKAIFMGRDASQFLLEAVK